MRMKYNNRYYPHPVLGISDDVTGEFNCNLSVSSTKDKIILKPTFKLVNEDLEVLIGTGKVFFCMHVYCRGTLFRENWKIMNPISTDIKISADDLNGETEVDFFICAENVIQKYKNKGSNPVFAGYEFQIEPADILAYGGKGKFFANKSPEQLKAVSSIMRIKRGKYKSGPFYLEYDNKFIIICLSDNDFESYRLLKNYPNNVNIIHASLILPALLETILFMNESDSGIDEYKESEWFKILDKNLAEAKGSTALEKIQNILNLPITREFLTLENIIEEAV